MSDVSIWEKLKIMTAFVSSVLIPIVLLIIGSNFNAALKEKETRTKYLELATKILGEQTHPSNYKIRSWAVDVINHYSEVPLPKPTQEELVKDYRIVGQFVRINDMAQYEWIPSIVEKYWNDKKFQTKWNKVKQERDLQKQKAFLSDFASEIEHEVISMRNKEFNKLGIMTWPPYWTRENKLLD
jgi:hypothetical protein